MNTRINELADLAGDYADTQVNTHRCDACGECDECINWCDVYNAKFAELIVKECVKQIQQQVSLKYKDGKGETEEFMAGHYGGSLLSRVVIKEHFGVTE